jgi:hypothetical protein
MVDRGMEGRDTMDEHLSERPKVKDMEMEVEDMYTEVYHTEEGMRGWRVCRRRVSKE